MKRRHVSESVFKLVVVLILATLIVLEFRGNDLTEVVYVDAVRLMNEYKGMERARTELDEKASVWKANLDTLKSELEIAVADLRNSKDKTMVQEDLVRKRKENLRRYSQIVDEQYVKSERELLNVMLVKVNDKIKTFAQERGYRIILSGTQFGTIAYADESLDITEELIRIVNDEYDASK